ncbi:hypothetical protein HAX54_034320, partial [Datura stramonium]|nr:hypothetical protein [Datura stramonium]
PHDVGTTMREAALLQLYAWRAAALLQLNNRRQAPPFLGRGRREVPQRWRTDTRDTTLLPRDRRHAAASFPMHWHVLRGTRRDSAKRRRGKEFPTPKNWFPTSTRKRKLTNPKTNSSRNKEEINLL